MEPTGSIIFFRTISKQFSHAKTWDICHKTCRRQVSGEKTSQKRYIAKIRRKKTYDNRNESKVEHQKHSTERTYRKDRGRIRAIRQTMAWNSRRHAAKQQLQISYPGILPGSPDGKLRMQIFILRILATYAVLKLIDWFFKIRRVHTKRNTKTWTSMVY